MEQLPMKPPARFSDSDSDGGNQGAGAVETIDRLDIPKMYKVILLNDDFTPMDFVVLVLRRYFNKTEEQATEVMLDVHKKGAGVAGVFTLEMAEMKSMQVNQFARMNQHPLKCTLEAE
jgi:ATP-dependent Clp protease adaptor protein ClpS